MCKPKTKGNRSQTRLLSRCEELLSPLLPCLIISYNMWRIYNACIRVLSQCVVTAGLRFILAWWVSHRAETSLQQTLRCYLCKFCWIGLFVKMTGLTFSEMFSSRNTHKIYLLEKQNDWRYKVLSEKCIKIKNLFFSSCFKHKLSISFI